MSSKVCSCALQIAVLALAIATSALAQSPNHLTFHYTPASTGGPAVRITAPIDEGKLVTLSGNTHPLATAPFDQGAVSDTFMLDHMFLQLRRSPEQEASLETLIGELQDPHSALYHKWLTADELGANFGPAQQDIDAVVEWLSSHGLQVNGISKTGLTVDISGTAGQVRDTFHTEIHRYNVDGQVHIANASDPQIPAALAPLVAGVVSLHDFMPKAALSKPKPDFSFKCVGCPPRCEGCPPFDNIEQYDEAPPDFAAIYNVTPLYTAAKPITGKGQTIAVLERTDINPADVATFRSAFGLSKYHGTLTQIHPGPGCSDPGKNGDEIEAAVDSEWAGAVAPDAAVVVASCADTATQFGAFIAAQNLLNSQAPPPIMSISYLDCEAYIGPAQNAYINDLWQQAASEGISVFVSSADNGAAACDFGAYAVSGIAANGLASTPHNVAVGATDFLDTFEGTNSTYWSKTNSATGKSAKSYIPEMPWNASCASNILYTYWGYKNGLESCNSAVGMGLGWSLNVIAGGGAPSFIYSKPYWQKGIIGNSNDGKRDLPDVALFGSGGIWYHAVLFCFSDPTQGGAPCDYSNPLDTFYNSAGGTSFSAPQFASIQALINQKAGGPQGNPNPIYYDLYKADFGTSSSPDKTDLGDCNASKGNAIASTCIFHDVTVGNNDLPCYGPNNCYDPTPADYGVLSTSDSSLHIAYPAHTGWDFTSGLGSVNVTNLVNRWP